jgi:hypothetical protein
MSKRTICVLALTAFLGFAGSSCIIHAPRHGHKQHAVKAKKSKKCKPSHYWDGKKCRHKGKGKGARKHDY